MKARNIIEKFREHERAGTFPKWIAAKAPVLQACKEYEEYQGNYQEGGPVHAAAVPLDEAMNAEDPPPADAPRPLIPTRSPVKEELDVATLTYNQSLLSHAIKDKQNEVLFLEYELSDSKLMFNWWRKAEELYTAVSPRWKVPVIDHDEVRGFTENPILKVKYRAIRANGSIFMGAAIQIVSLRERAANIKSKKYVFEFQKKKEIQQAADVEMADASRPGPSVQSLIDKGISAGIKRLEQRLSKSNTPSGSGASSSKGLRGPTHTPKPGRQQPSLMKQVKKNAIAQSAKVNGHKKQAGKKSKPGSSSKNTGAGSKKPPKGGQGGKGKGKARA
ncbi:hypothetical protein QCA50_010071 [Cerrena zonata]|uniref:Uncharacterized protein n=1 Tax=Cerrena zonata TaxID=2478898 RepID=A0AAW0FZ43_9APHY